MSVDWIIELFSGAVGAALVAGIFGLITWKWNRKASREDKAQTASVANCVQRGEEINAINIKVNALIVADRTILYDRIKHLAKAYIKKGWVSVEDYEDLKRMHKVYHDELDGNGFLDDLMRAVTKLEKRVT